MPFDIAIIDQGVETSHHRLEGCVFDGIELREEGKNDFRLYKDTYGADDTGHGTSMAGIIHSVCPSARLFVIKLSSHTGKISEALLCEALHHCAGIDSVRIVNVSMGIEASAPSPLLWEAAMKNHSSGKLVVAAGNNDYDTPKGFFPAHFPFVFGVTVGMVRNRLEYGYREGVALDILAKGTTQRVPTSGNRLTFTGGCSIAAAHFSGIAGDLLCRYPDKDAKGLASALKEGARPGVRELFFRRETAAPMMPYREAAAIGSTFDDPRVAPPLPGLRFDASKLALFPVSDASVNSLLFYARAHPLNITTFIDYPIITHNTLPATRQRVHRDLDSIDYAAFDTLVLDHLTDEKTDVNIYYGIELLRRCLRGGKHLVFWDNHLQQLVDDLVREEMPPFPPRVSNLSFVPRLYGHGHLPPGQPRPTLCVMPARSNRESLFTQLRLRDILLKRGHTTGHIGTEPQGALLGASPIFPYSLAAPAGTPWETPLKTLIREVICRESPDLILTGTTAPVRPPGANLSSLRYLAALEPTAIVYAFPSDDDLDSVQNAVNCVEYLTGAKVLFCAMVPSRGRHGTASGIRSIPVFDVADPRSDPLIADILESKLDLPICQQLK